MINELTKKYAKPTPAKWRKIGDSILFFSIGLQPMITTLPLTEHQMLWINFGIGALGVIGKTLTNFAE